MSDFVFRKYKGEDKEQVLALLGANLWHFPYKERLAYFNWKYEQNPYTDAPLGFVCLDGERIISFRGYMTQPISIAGKTFYSVASGDTVTDSDYRRKGVFERMTKYSLEELEKDSRIKVITNSSSGWPTSSGCQKLGWYPLTKRGHLFSFTWRSFVSKQCVPTFSRHVKGDICIILSTECKAVEMGRLAQSNVPLDLISVFEDEKYISWRYANPHSQYFFAYCYRREELNAYLVLKRISGRKYDLVDSQYGEEKHLRLMLRKMHKWLNPLYIINWIVNQNNVINLHPSKFGFIDLNLILNRMSKFKKPPFLIRTTKVCQQERDWKIIEGKDMRNIANWSINKVIADEI